MKIHNRKELQQIAVDHSAEIDHKDFVKIYGDCILYRDFTETEPYSFFTIDTTSPADDHLRFRKNISDSPSKNHINGASKDSSWQD